MTADTQNSSKEKNKVIDWIIRFIKGMFIGTGAILPGVSGGALAAVFGMYERIIAFLSDLRKDFIKNVFFFIPVGFGFVFGFLILTHPITYFLEVAKVQVLWCFIGCIAGTLPSLYREAGKNGRKSKHIVLMLITAVIGLTGLLLARKYLNISVPINTGTLAMGGAIFALGMIVPGLSPSNFLMYFQMYEPLMAKIKDLDISAIIPFGIGALACILLLAKLMSKILEAAYAGVFHFILGIVIASTIIIAPVGSDYSGITTSGIVVSVILCLSGFALGFFMGKLEEKYKKD